MRGRKPSPTWLKVVSGNPGKRPLNHDEPRPSGDLKDPPDWFSPRQRIIWDQCIRNAPAGLLKLLDATVLEVFVVAKQIHEDAAMKVEKFGAVVKLEDGSPMRSPFIGVMNQQAAFMLKCCAEMGFTPSARSRVKVEGGKKGRSAFADLRALSLDMDADVTPKA